MYFHIFRELLNDTKTDDRQRVLPLPEVTMQQIRLHQERQNLFIRANKKNWENNDLVFPDSNGKLRGPAPLVQTISENRPAGEFLDHLS